MGTATGYNYILPELTTVEYYLVMFALNRCKDNISYGFRIRPLIGKLQTMATVTGHDQEKKVINHGQ